MSVPEEVLVGLDYGYAMLGVVLAIAVALALTGELRQRGGPLWWLCATALSLLLAYPVARLIVRLLAS